MKKHNFYAGPAILTPFTIENTAKAVTNFNNTGLSILEISHRSKEFIQISQQAQSLLKELLDIPKGYHTLFLGGGASTQFFSVPYNLLNKKAAYLTTGAWANKAIKEAHNFGKVVEVASSKDKNYNYIPKNYTIPEDADYLHITTNNTIFGTEIKKDIEAPIPLVADMSSDILSRPIDISKYSVIYGGAQKNLGPSGVTFVIVNENALGKINREIPTMIDYRTHIDKESMFNTPPCLPIYSVLQTLIWIKDQGGVKKIQKNNIEKANLLYNEIERNKLFKTTVTDKEDQSLMNICFIMNEEYKDLEKNFSNYAAERGMIGINGHRSVGGFRASTYNAMPKESVAALVKTMQDFEKTI